MRKLAYSNQPEVITNVSDVSLRSDLAAFLPAIIAVFESHADDWLDPILRQITSLQLREFYGSQPTSDAALPGVMFGAPTLRARLRSAARRERRIRVRRGASAPGHRAHPRDPPVTDERTTPVLRRHRRALRQSGPRRGARTWPNTRSSCRSSSSRGAKSTRATGLSGVARASGSYAYPCRIGSPVVKRPARASWMRPAVTTRHGPSLGGGGWSHPRRWRSGWLPRNVCSRGTITLRGEASASRSNARLGRRGVISRWCTKTMTMARFDCALHSHPRIAIVASKSFTVRHAGETMKLPQIICLSAVAACSNHATWDTAAGTEQDADLAQPSRADELDPQGEIERPHASARPTPRIGAETLQARTKLAATSLGLEEPAAEGHVAHRIAALSSLSDDVACGRAAISVTMDTMDGMAFPLSIMSITPEDTQEKPVTVRFWGDPNHESEQRTSATPSVKNGQQVCVFYASVRNEAWITGDEPVFYVNDGMVQFEKHRVYPNTFKRVVAEVKALRGEQ